MSSAIYFCGGPLDGLCHTVKQLLSFTAFKYPITDYQYSNEVAHNRPHNIQAQVWHYKFSHEPSQEGFYMSDIRQTHPTLVEQLWIEVDACYKKLMNDNTMTADQTTALKGYMRGIAWTLSKFMRPYFTSANAIVGEVQKRHTMRTAGEAYETPGLGSRMTEAIPGSNSKYTDVHTAPAPVNGTSKFSEEQIRKIKNARDRSGLPIEAVAQSYKITVKELQSL